jgi:hypothetical protein
LKSGVKEMTNGLLERDEKIAIFETDNNYKNDVIKELGEKISKLSESENIPVGPCLLPGKTIFKKGRTIPPNQKNPHPLPSLEFLMFFGRHRGRVSVQHV